MNNFDNNVKKGGISVDTEHIFPIIKKWLYSEKDIFLREIVSNAADAITKLKRLGSLGIREDQGEEYRITVTLDEEAKTLTVSDNGIGMTEEELTKYICSIALSGAVDFIKKYENEAESSKNGIIGHFGLGFYSAFMVSSSVEVLTRSYTDAPAVHWVCNESGEYESSLSERDTHGTDVIMHISEDEREYLSASKIRAMLEKYCSFMPIEIYFDDGSEKKEGDEEKPVNDVHPLWQKSPSECSDEEYKEFYSKVFRDFKEPLFHIHINADYPLNFKGILYFPRFANDYEAMEGQVKLYYNQVFVADNIKEVIPEYLLVLKGVLDCPELPLNVSRSYLQTNSYVSKVSAHIVKKLADRLNYLCANERENYESIWKDICPFISYACMKDKKFYDRVKGSLLLPLTSGGVMTYSEYLESAKEKNENTVYYATDKDLQAQYISMFTAEGINVALFERPIEAQFSTMLEHYMEGVKFVRVDAEIAESLKGDGETTENEELKALFLKVSGNEKLNVKFDALKNADIPALLNISEETRRMDEMMKFYGMGDISALPNDSSLVLNTASPLINKLADAASSDPEKAEMIASFIYKVSLLSQKKFSAEEMQSFIGDSFDILMKL
ncbi:MAG: molecular chaperone HtpG [Ruminococcaceae bacterium]|nr:molecular chaperone HtpG [Oscillospiraceae bacterium]